MAVAAELFPSPTGAVLVTTGEAYPDAVTAAALGHPVLLVTPQGPTDDTLEQVARLSAGGDAPVLGGLAAVGSTATDAVAEATLLVLAVAPRFVQGALPNIPTTILVQVSSSAVDDTQVTLAATVTAGEVAVHPPAVDIGEVAEVTFTPPPVSDEELVTLTITAERGGVMRAQTRDIVVMPGEDTVSGDARAVLGQFLPTLARDHPELGLDPEAAASFVGSITAPRLLVVSHYGFFDERWELGLSWHIMVAPDDWAELYLRPRGEFSPTRAFRLSSWSTALAGGDSTITEIDPPIEIVR